jgi:predicted DNA-binding transcriptional regulator AlpA
MKTFISSKETARRLAINYTTLIRWRNKQQGPPAYRLGKMWKYDSTEVDTYIQSCRHQPQTNHPHP